MRRLGRAMLTISLLITFSPPITASAVSANPAPDCSAGTSCTITFTYTGDYYSWTVPGGVSSINFDVKGAQGGNGVGGGGTGASGGRVVGTLTTTPGSVLYFYVGGKGANGQTGASSTGGYNGGGNGGYDTSNPSSYSGGAGGGASDIRSSASDTAYTNRLVVAGGGGGASGGCTANGGSGGNTSAASGTYCGNAVAGGGGTQSAGGTAYTSRNSTAGVFGIGGSAGNRIAYGSGGGGGGYYGGGAGSSTQDHGSGWGGGGGGGSSFTHASLVTSFTHSQGVQTGNGVIAITYVAALPVVSTTVAGNVKAVAKGQMVVLTTNVDQAGKVTFYADGKRIPNCISISTSGGNVTCNWKPIVGKVINITASIFQNGVLKSTSPVLTLTSTKRTGTR